MKGKIKTEIHIFDKKTYRGKIRTAQYKSEVTYLFSRNRIEKLPVKIYFLSLEDTSVTVILVASKSELSCKEVVAAVC